MNHHSVSLKVLRLSSLQGGAGADQALQLPSSFGTIYQSEYFTALVSLKLEEHHQVNNPRLTIHLQTPDQQKTTIDSLHATTLELNSSKLDTIIHHQITHLGLHSLICTVSYDELIINDHVENQQQQSETQTRSFRKLYKFQALNPLLVNIKIIQSQLNHQLDHQQGQLGIERFKEILEKLKLEKNTYNNNNNKNNNDDSDRFSLIKKEEGVNNGGFYLQVSIQNQALKPLDLELNILLNHDKIQHQDQDGQEEKFKVIDFSSRMKLVKMNHSSWSQQEEERRRRILLPGDVYDYSFKIEENYKINQPSFKNLEKQDKEGNDIENEDDDADELLELEIKFKDLMGETGKLIKNLSNHQKNQKN